MSERVSSFKAKGAKSHPCGEKSFWDMFRKPVYIKDLDGNILYEGRGTFQRTLEKAVREGVELPRADLRNQNFEALYIPNAKLKGASFDGSTFAKKICYYSYIPSNLSGCDLREVSFKNTNFSRNTAFANSDVAQADFAGEAFGGNFTAMKNLDKAYNVRKIDFIEWLEIQEEARKYGEVVNPKPIDVAKLKAGQSR